MKPVYYNNPANTFIRMGSGDQRATEGEIRAMFRDQSFGKKTEEIIPESGIEMLNLNTLRSYRYALSQTSNLLEYRDVDDVEFCEHVNITNKGLLTYAGLLMFGKAPYVLRYVPTFCVDYIEIPAPTIQEAEVRYTYRIPEQENIWEAVQIILRRFRTLVDAPYISRMMASQPLTKANITYCAKHWQTWSCTATTSIQCDLVSVYIQTTSSL